MTACTQEGLPFAPIELVAGDILTEDWSNADVILASAVCYSIEVLEAMADKCQFLKSGTRMIFLNFLPHRPYIRLYASCKVKYSWGLHDTLFYIV